LFKYQGIYITDKIFDEEDIEPKENVRSEVLRLNAVQAVKDIFTGVKRPPKDKISKQMVSRVKDSVNDTL
jgi:hypothetical protein